MFTLKILEINSVCGIRSTGRICTDIMDCAENHGMECIVAYGRERSPEKYAERSVLISKKVGVYVHALLARLFDMSGFGSKAATKRFLKKLDEYAPDVVHVHNLHGYYVNLPLLFKHLKKRNIPVIMTLHDCWTFTGHCSHFESALCERWMDGSCHSCPQLKEYPKSLIDRSRKNFKKKKACFTMLDDLTVVTPSEWLARNAKASFLNKYPIKVINNGIDLDAFTPQESDLRQKYGIENKKVALGVASAWNDKKGLSDFIRLSSLLPDSWTIVLIGLTDEQKSSLPSNMIGITRTNSISELAEWYSTADVFLNLTYEDTFPTVNLEAQACGTPVITYATGGSPESIIQGKTGLVTSKKSPEEITRVIDSVKKDSDACRKNAEHYDKWQQFEKYVEEYRSKMNVKDN